MAVFLKRDFQFAAVGQLHAFAQAAVAAKAVEHPRHGARVLAEFGGLALEAVNFLNDFDGNEDVIVLKAQQRMRIVQEDIGIKDVVLHNSKQAEMGGTRKRVAGAAFFHSVLFLFKWLIRRCQSLR